MGKTDAANTLAPLTCDLTFVLLIQETFSQAPNMKTFAIYN